jgi:hypothetical protein
MKPLSSLLWMLPLALTWACSPDLVVARPDGGGGTGGEGGASASGGGVEGCDAGGDCDGGASDAPVYPPACIDGIKNGKETDTDCGGGECAPCGTDDDCKMDSDCQSGFCTQADKKCS